MFRSKPVTEADREKAANKALRSMGKAHRAGQGDALDQSAAVVASRACQAAGYGRGAR